jgi:hypothetical protein
MGMNDRIFNDCVEDVDEIFYSIKVLSWYWSLNILNIGVLCIISGVGILEIVCLGKLGGAFGFLFVICFSVLF